MRKGLISSDKAYASDLTTPQMADLLHYGLERGFQHVTLDVFEGAAHFLPGVEDILRIEDIFGSFEEGDHFGAEEHR
jgi:hypothetical protein